MVRNLSRLAPVSAPDPGEPDEETLRALLSAYELRGRRIASLLRKASLTDFQRARYNDLLSQIRAEVKVLDEKASAFAGKETPKAYRRGLALARSIARDAGNRREINFGSLINKRSVRVLSESIAADLVKGNRSIIAVSQVIIRRTQQRVIEDAAISRIIAGGVIGGETRRQTSDAILDGLRARLADGALVEINGRGYRPDAYAELVARTRTREAASQGTINGAASLGMDLVQIDVHGDACPICRSRMGRVYSISGRHADFPKLDARPPFHVNCKCNLYAVTETALRARNQYDALVSLSATPRFERPKDAEAWLKRNPTKNIATYTDFQTFLKGARK